MDKKSSIALILTASVLGSLCGCSGEKQAMVKATDDYASAVTKFDCGDIADLMEDDDAEDELEALKEKYESSPVYEEVYDAVLGSMSYEVDETSAKAGSVSVTFTMVDYEAVYEDVSDEGGSINDYIVALEDADDTVEITQTIDLVKDKDEWLIKDKDFDNLLEIYEFIDVIPGYSWCSFDVMTLEEFEDILTDELGFDYSEIDAMYDDYGTFEMSEINMGNFYIMIQVYNDDYDYVSAQDAFEGIYIQLDSEDPNMYKSYFDGDTGYILFNGDYYVELEEAYYYGGIYVKGNMIVGAVAMEPDGFDEDYYSYKTVNAFLEAAGLPKPF